MGIHSQAKAFRDDAKDAIPREAWAAVKMAIRQTVAHYGKADAFAEKLTEITKIRWHGGRLSEWSTMTNPTDLPDLWQVAQIEALAGVDWITQAMCALHNADLVKRGKADAAGAVMERLAVAIKEFGEALSTGASVAAKPDCRRTAAEFLREGPEGIRALMELVAAVEAQIGQRA